MSSQYKAACQKSSQPKKGVSGFFGIKVNLTIHYSLFTIHYSLFTIHYSLFKHGSTVHGYCSRFLFCLFKEVRASFVSTFNFTFNFRLLCSPFSLLSLSPFSLPSLSSCNPFKLQAFFKLSYLCSL